MPSNASSDDNRQDAATVIALSQPQSVNPESHAAPMITISSTESSPQPDRRRASSSHPILCRPSDRLLTLYMIAILTVTIFFLVRENGTDNEATLRMWLIVNAVLTFIRITGWIGMHSFPVDRWMVLRTFLTWFFRLLNMASVAWFIVGIAYLQHEKAGKGDAIRSLVIAIIIIELVVLTITIVLGFLIFLFALRPVLSNRQNIQGATKEDISKLSSFRYASDSCDAQSCSICLCDYEEDEVLRELPCTASKHIFHAACIDEWLLQKASCPICRDDPLNPKQTQPYRTTESTLQAVNNV